MKEVPTITLDSGLIICQAACNTCPYTDTCANHNSAWGSRTEDGFTPQLTRMVNSVGFRECRTAEAHEAADGLPLDWLGLDRGALCTDGSTCARMAVEPPVERTFREALNNAREALDEAWEKMPTGEAGRVNDGIDGWAVQRLLIASRQNLIYLVDHIDGWV